MTRMLSTGGNDKNDKYRWEWQVGMTRMISTGGNDKNDKYRWE